MNPSFVTHRLLRATLLVATLLIAQWALALHQSELSAHAGGGACEFCLTHAELADGATFISPAPAFVPAALDVPLYFSAAFAAPRHSSYSARAPPLS